MEIRTPYQGIIAEREPKQDWLGSEISIPRAPLGTQSFKKNGSIQYSQDEVSPVSCTLHGAMGAYSDLTGYKFTLEQRNEIWGLAVKAGADPDVGWWIDSAVNLVRNWVNEHLLFKVKTYRIELDSEDFWMALAMGYSVVSGFRGNAAMLKDRTDGILDGLTFGKTYWGHCLRVAYSVGDAEDLVIDNYPSGKYNTFKVPMENWRKLVENGIFFNSGYIFLKK